MLDSCLNTVRAMLLAGLLFVLTITSAIAQGVNDSWTSELASIEEITTHFSDQGELDNAARQYVAFETIHFALEEKVGSRIYSNEVTSREKAALDAFREAKNDVEMAMYSKYQKADNAKYMDYQQRRADFRSDESNLYEILDRFAPPLVAVMAPKIAAQASDRRQSVARKLDRVVQGALWLAFWTFLAIIFLYLLVGSWRDKRIKLGVEVEDLDDMTIITYKPGKHGPVAAMSIYPLYINIVLFMATVSVGLIFMLAAAERSEWFQNLMSVPLPNFMRILFYKAFWVGLGLFIVFAPWWLLAIANFRRRRPEKIVVTPDAIIVGRNTYVLDSLRSFYAWGYGDGSSQPADERADIVVAGGNAGARAAAAGAMHGAAIRESAGLFARKVGRVGNQVVGEFGEQKHVLAKWLPSVRSTIVADEIEKAIQRLRGRDSSPATAEIQ